MGDDEQKMPELRGTTYAEAVEKLRDGAGDVLSEAAYGDESAYDSNNSSGDYAGWTVCFQSVEAGEALSEEPGVTLHVVEPGDTCPLWAGQHRVSAASPSPDDPGTGSSGEEGPEYVAPDPVPGASEDEEESDSEVGGGEDEDYYPGDRGGCPPGGCYNPCPPGGCR
ncbi:PASTA domain-containing protein [Streptomyces wuyuanensis]|uniref:PASTA domain-containing protein n=1 Tax=Streptomyces wuyuanensis TaxID=1196353 RepID=UPI00343D035A